MKKTTELILDYLQDKNPELLEQVKQSSDEEIKSLAHKFTYGEEINKFGEWAYERSMQEHSIGLLLFTSAALETANRTNKPHYTLGEGVELLLQQAFQEIKEPSQ